MDNSIQIQPEEIRDAATYEDMVSTYMNLNQADNWVKWYKGDIVANLQHKYGDNALAKFGQEVGEARSTLENYRRMSRAFTSDRRHYNLPYTAFLYASLADEYDRTTQTFLTDERFDWLEKAETNGWSAKALYAKLLETRQIASGAQNIDLAIGTVERFENAILQFDFNSLGEDGVGKLIIRLEKLLEKLTRYNSA